MEEATGTQDFQTTVVGDADFPGRCSHVLTSGRRCARTTVSKSGRCAWHSGLSQRFSAREARYEKYLSRDEALRLRFYHFFDDPDICDLRPELALMRSMLSQVLELAGASDDAEALLDPRIMTGVDTLTKSVANLAEKCARMEKRGDGWISRKQADAFVEYVVSVISDHIDDHVTLVSIQRQLEVAALPAVSQAALAADLEPRGDYADADEAGEGSGSDGEPGSGSQDLHEDPGSGNGSVGG